MDKLIKILGIAFLIGIMITYIVAFGVKLGLTVIGVGLLYAVVGIVWEAFQKALQQG